MQNAVVKEATALSNTLTLPILPEDVVNGLLDSTNSLGKAASGFVPFLHGSAKAPANNGITLVLNTTEVHFPSLRNLTMGHSQETTISQMGRGVPVSTGCYALHPSEVYGA